MMNIIFMVVTEKLSKEQYHHVYKYFFMCLFPEEWVLCVGGCYQHGGGLVSRLRRVNDEQEAHYSESGDCMYHRAKAHLFNFDMDCCCVGRGHWFITGWCVDTEKTEKSKKYLPLIITLHCLVHDHCYWTIHSTSCVL